MILILPLIPEFPCLLDMPLHLVLFFFFFSSWFSICINGSYFNQRDHTAFNRFIWLLPHMTPIVKHSSYESVNCYLYSGIAHEGFSCPLPGSSLPICFCAEGDLTTGQLWVCCPVPCLVAMIAHDQCPMSSTSNCHGFQQKLFSEKKILPELQHKHLENHKRLDWSNG